MSDIRFKIAGDGGPFVAKICNQGSPTVLEKQLVEFTGVSLSNGIKENYSTVFFGGLNENTKYVISVEDSVGKLTGLTATTPTATTPTNPVVIIPEVEVNLPGTIYIPPPLTGCYQCINDELEISPALSSGQCIDFELCASGNSRFGDCAYISAYCMQSGSTTWSKILSVESEDNIDDEDVHTGYIKPGDRICYDMVVEIEHNPATQSTSEACGWLCLNRAVSGGSALSVTCDNTYLKEGFGLYCQTTTTTSTTTETPVKVYFDNVVENTIGLGGNGTAILATDPPLSSLPGTPSFNLRMVMRSSYTKGLSVLLAEVCGCGQIDSPAPIECACVISDTDSPPISRECIITRTVNESNIGNFAFSYCIDDGTKNQLIDHTVSACICLDSIPSSSGGNFTIGTGTNEKCIGKTAIGISP